MFKRVICCLFALTVAACAAAPSSFTASAAVAAKVYRVTFSAGGGKTIPAAAVEPGGTVSKPTDPQKAGYRFTGWYTTPRKTGAYDFSSPVTAAVRLYAGWEKLPQASFSTLGGRTEDGRSSIKPIAVNFGETIESLPVVSKPGFKFEGWHTDRKGDVKFDPSQPLNAPVRLYAKWVKIPQASFMAGSGIVIPKQQLILGSAAAKPADPEKAGFDFQGWYTDNAKTKPYDFSQPVNGELRLYAKWIPLPSVTFSAAGARNAPPKQTLAKGEKPVKPETDPEKAGYSFNGWYADKRYTVEFDFSQSPEGAATAYAKWVRNPVVSFSTKGKAPTPAKQTLTAGGQATAPSVTNPHGYTLEGWYRDSACKKPFDFGEKIESSITLYANWVQTAQ